MVNPNTEIMQASINSNRKNTRPESSKQTKLIKRFYSQFLEAMARKTDSEKRIRLYGNDPFK
jgi:hypothetical protein